MQTDVCHIWNHKDVMRRGPPDGLTVSTCRRRESGAGSRAAGRFSSSSQPSRNSSETWFRWEEQNCQQGENIAGVRSEPCCWGVRGAERRVRLPNLLSSRTPDTSHGFHDCFPQSPRQSTAGRTAVSRRNLFHRKHEKKTMIEWRSGIRGLVFSLRLIRFHQTAGSFLQFDICSLSLPVCASRTLREGYGARVAVQCTWTLQQSPAGSEGSVCWEVSPCLSCPCSSSSSDWALPTAGPGETQVPLEEGRASFKAWMWFHVN